MPCALHRSLSRLSADIAQKEVVTVYDWRFDSNSLLLMHMNLFCSPVRRLGLLLIWLWMLLAASSALAQLKQNRWLDEGTRALFINANMYVPALNVIALVTYVMEFPAAGGTVIWQMRIFLSSY